MHTHAVCQIVLSAHSSPQGAGRVGPWWASSPDLKEEAVGPCASRDLISLPRQMRPKATEGHSHVQEACWHEPRALRTAEVGKDMGTTVFVSLLLWRETRRGGSREHAQRSTNQDHTSCPLPRGLRPSGRGRGTRAAANAQEGLKEPSTHPNRGGHSTHWPPTCQSPESLSGGQKVGGTSVHSHEERSTRAWSLPAPAHD